MSGIWTELAGAGDAGLVERVVRLAASGWADPEKIRDAVVPRLADAEVTAVSVVDALERCGRDLASPRETERAGRALLDAGATVSVLGDVSYPRRLADAWPELGAPVWLFVRSPDCGLLPDGPAVAVVGTRHPTLDGLGTATELGALLGRSGVTVVSGMARGIDQAAHAGALRAGGTTVAVLGTGFGVDYPAHDGSMREAVARSGGLVSEFVPGTGPRPRNFLWRNRIVSGLADVTVVVEGQARSGALHTARMAAAQGRDVMAVPGSLRAPTSRAPLDLLRDGATPLTRLTDVLAFVGVEAAPDGDQPGPAGPQPAVSESARAVLALLGAVPARPGSLASACGLAVPAVLAAVGELSAAGLATTTGKGIVRLG